MLIFSRFSKSALLSKHTYVRDTQRVDRNISVPGVAKIHSVLKVTWTDTFATFTQVRLMCTLKFLKNYSSVMS